MKACNTHMNIMSLSMCACKCAYTHTPVKIVSSSSFGGLCSYHVLYQNELLGISPCLCASRH